MHKRETRPARQRWTGLESRLLVTPPSSLLTLQTQPVVMSGYQIDAQCTVLPMWRRHHE